MLQQSGQPHKSEIIINKVCHSLSAVGPASLTLLESLHMLAAVDAFGFKAIVFSAEETEVIQ